MKISARNCIEGKVVAIHDGPVSTEVTVETPAGERIVSSITTTSAKTLGLKVGVRGDQGLQRHARRRLIEFFNEFTLFIIVRQLSQATWIGVTKGEIQSSQHQQPRAFCCLQTQVDFLPVLKGGDSLDHAVSWFKGGSH